MAEIGRPGRGGGRGCRHHAVTVYVDHNHSCWAGSARCRPRWRAAMRTDVGLLFLWFHIPHTTRRDIKRRTRPISTRYISVFTVTKLQKKKHDNKIMINFHKVMSMKTQTRECSSVSTTRTTKNKGSLKWTSRQLYNAKDATIYMFLYLHVLI